MILKILNFLTMVIIYIIALQIHLLYYIYDFLYKLFNRQKIKRIQQELDKAENY